MKTIKRSKHGKTKQVIEAENEDDESDDPSNATCHTSQVERNGGEPLSLSGLGDHTTNGPSPGLAIPVT